MEGEGTGMKYMAANCEENRSPSMKRSRRWRRNSTDINVVMS
jgi:hypothetical protein